MPDRVFLSQDKNRMDKIFVTDKYREGPKVAYVKESAVKEDARVIRALEGALEITNKLLHRRVQADRERREVEFMLKHRDECMLQWVEPGSAIDPHGETADATIISRATVSDCINMARAQAEEREGRMSGMDDRDHLLNFMALHWAEPVRE